MSSKSSSSPHIIAPRSHVSQEMREARQPHGGMVFWLTGLSGAGKSTLAHNAELQLFQEGYNILVLDGDAIRTGLCKDLGFSEEDREENNRRVAEIAKVIMRSGTVCLCAFISPAAQARDAAKNIVGENFFREIFIACSPEECEKRDVKGFYEKARRGEIEQYTGVSAGYEEPKTPDLEICTDSNKVEFCTTQLLDYIRSQCSDLAPKN